MTNPNRRQASTPPATYTAPPVPTLGLILVAIGVLLGCTVIACYLITGHSNGPTTPEPTWTSGRR